MKVELNRDYAFEAAHRLPRVPAEHQCSRMHGHSFRVTITLAGEMDERMGWLVDFDAITKLVQPIIDDELDHRTLNDVPGLENPTSEVLSVWLWKRLRPLLPQLSGVTVHETCTARCTYRGE